VFKPLVLVASLSTFSFHRYIYYQFIDSVITAVVAVSIALLATFSYEKIP